MCCPTGRVARSGGPELALELEQSGYAEFGERRRRKGRRRMELPVKQFQTQAEQAYLDLFAARRAGASRRRQSLGRRSARQGHRSLWRARAAASPHRGLEIYRPPLPADRGPSAGPCRPAWRVATPISREALGDDVAALPAYRLVVVEGDLRADLSDIAGLKEAGVEVLSLDRSAWQAAVAGSKSALGKSIRATTIRCSRSTPL